MARAYITAPPTDAKFVWEDSGDYTSQTTSYRILPSMKSAVAAMFVSPPVLGPAGLGAASMLIPTISSAYATMASPLTKTLVFFDQDVEYSVPENPGICRAEDIVRGTTTPHIVYMNREAAEEAAKFGSGVIYCIVKRGACIDDDSVELMQKLAKALKAPRFEKVLIISDSKSNDEEIARARRVFHGITFTYDEIGF